MQKQVFSLTLLLLAALLSGCIEQLNFQANTSISVQNGSVQASLNATGVPQLAAQQINLVPRNATVCIYGEANERFSFNGFGNLSIAGNEVPLYTMWFDANSTTRNASFSQCAVIVLLDDNEGKFIERNVREKIVAQLKRGAGLLVSGMGGALSAQDGSVYGWEVGGLQEFVPVIIESPGKDAVPLGRTTFSGKFVAVKQDPSVIGVDEFLFDSWSVVHSLPLPGAQTIAFERSGGQTLPTQPVYPAVVRTPENSLRNAGYYFSFNAPDSPQVFINTVRFLSSEYFKFFFLRVG